MAEMANLKSVDAGNFEDEVLKATSPVLVDFWAPWCPPCRALAPTLEELAVEMSGRIEVVKLNIQEVPLIHRQYGVMNIPTLILFKEGQPVAQIVGNLPKAALKQKIESAL